MESDHKSLSLKQDVVLLHCLQLAQRYYKLYFTLHPEKKRDSIIIVQSIARKYLAHQRYKVLKATERQRQNILNEMFVTEQKYHSQLKTIMEVFYTPLLHISKQHDSFVTEDDVKNMFHSIETVFSISTELLERLKERLGEDGWTSHKNIADIFLRVAPYMKAFKGYYENYDNALSHIQKLKTTSIMFAKFVATAEKHPDCFKLDLPSLLITPIQRMPRYELLLAALTQHTSQESKDWEICKQAAAAIQKVNKQINEGMRFDSTQKEMMVLQNLIDMQTKLLGLPSKHAALLPHRKLLRTGPVTMCSLKNGTLQKRILYLCNDVLITVTVFLNTAVKIDKELPLISAKVRLNPKDTEGTSFFVISPVKSHLFFCDSRAIVLSWKTDIELAIKQFVEASSENEKLRNSVRIIEDLDSTDFEDSFVVLSPTENRNHSKPQQSQPRPTSTSTPTSTPATPVTTPPTTPPTPRESSKPQLIPTLTPTRPISIPISTTPISSTPIPMSTTPTSRPMSTTPPKSTTPLSTSTPVSTTPTQTPIQTSPGPNQTRRVRFDASSLHMVLEASADYFARHDGCRHIPADSLFLVLPPSFQVMMFVSTGHVTLTNTGVEDILLRAHKRGCSKGNHVYGSYFKLIAKSSQSFDFKGAWYIETFGKYEDLIVSDLALSGGGKGNKLGMA